MWLSVCSEVQVVCIIAYGPADATASQNPVTSCLIQITTSFIFPVPAYPGSPANEAIKRV